MRRRGFLAGLMENLVAAAVILIGLSFLVTGIPLSNRAAHQAELRCQASDLAVLYVSKVRQSDVALYPGGTVQAISSGDFKGELRVDAVAGYQTLRDVTVVVKWDYAGMPGQMQRKARVGNASY